MADAAAALALADLRRRRRPPRYRANAIDDLRRQPGARPERGAARARSTSDGSAGCRPADPGGDTEHEGRRFRFDGIELCGLVALAAYRPLRDKAFRPVRLDLVPFTEHAPPEFRISMPKRPRRFET